MLRKVGVLCGYCDMRVPIADPSGPGSGRATRTGGTGLGRPGLWERWACGGRSAGGGGVGPAGDGTW